MQHVENISTLSDAKNTQLERAMTVGDRDYEMEWTAPMVEAAVAIRDENGAAQDGDGSRKNCKKPWVRQA